MVRWVYKEKIALKGMTQNENHQAQPDPKKVIKKNPEDDCY